MESAVQGCINDTRHQPVSSWSEAVSSPPGLPYESELLSLRGAEHLENKEVKTTDRVSKAMMMNMMMITLEAIENKMMTNMMVEDGGMFVLAWV